MNDNSLVYTVTTPGETVTSNPYDSTSTMFIEECEFGAGVNASIVGRPQAHGGYIDPGFKEHGVWVTKWRMIGAKDADVVSLARAVNSMLGSDGTGSATWVTRGGNQQTLSGLYLIDASAPKADAGSLVQQVMLGCEKPFAEDTEATITDSAALSAGGSGFTIPLEIPFELTASSGGDLAVTHSGTFPRAYPVLRAYGPLQNPQVINHTVGLRLSFDGSIASGDYWEIDLFAKTVNLNGTQSITAIDMSASDWWSCVLGVNDLQLSGSGYTAQTLLRCYFKNAWAS